MSDRARQTRTRPEATPPKPTRPNNTVPYERFAEVNDKAKKTAAELDELRQWKEQQEAKSMSELERERKRAEDAEKRAEEAAGASHRSSAADGFVPQQRTPGSSTRRTRSRTSTSPRLRRRRRRSNAVKRLAESKKHLLKPTDDKPALNRVLSRQRAGGRQDGQPAGEGADAKDQLGAGLLDFLTNRS
jgi:hypothetical protein